MQIGNHEESITNQSYPESNLHNRWFGIWEKLMLNPASYNNKNATLRNTKGYRCTQIPQIKSNSSIPSPRFQGHLLDVACITPSFRRLSLNTHPRKCNRTILSKVFVASRGALTTERIE